MPPLPMGRVPVMSAARLMSEVATAPVVVLRNPEREPIESPPEEICTPAKVEVAEALRRLAERPFPKVEVAVGEMLIVSAPVLPKESKLPGLVVPRPRRPPAVKTDASAPEVL